MTAAISSFPIGLDAPRAELARLCRKICIARERDGQLDRSLESEFQHALAEIHAHFGSESVSEEDLWEIVRVEEKRVADASVIAELLLPRLLTALRSQLPAPAPSPSLAPPPSASTPEPRTLSPAAPLGIADLLEGMLDQQRSELRSRHSSHRS